MFAAILIIWPKNGKLGKLLCISSHVHSLMYPPTDSLVVAPFPVSFATLKDRLMAGAPTDWCLFVDADERVNRVFLKNIRRVIEESKVLCFRFPMFNVDSTYPISDPQDWQVRLVNKRFGKWIRLYTR